MKLKNLLTEVRECFLIPVSAARNYENVDLVYHYCKDHDPGNFFSQARSYASA